MYSMYNSYIVFYRPELVSVMTAIGNQTSWSILEAKRVRARPNPNSSV